MDQEIKKDEMAERKKEYLMSWLYTFGIFVLITVVLFFPLIFSAEPLKLITLLLGLLLFGFIIALFSAYVLTPWSLGKEMQTFDNAPPEILKSLEELSKKAQIKKVPKLMITETSEINACTYESIFGSRIGVTTGLIDAYQSGRMNKNELEAILGHEIGHIKNKDSLRQGLVLSLISVFQVLGNWCIIIGSVLGVIGVATATISREEGRSTGIVITIIGVSLLIDGFLMKIIAKIASILSFYHSRKQEYVADQSAAELTSPEITASALQKIKNLNDELVTNVMKSLPYADKWQLQPRNVSWIDKLFDTHPPMEERIQRVRKIAEGSKRKEFNIIALLLI